MVEVRTLAPGAKVTQAGIYAGISLERYHGAITDGPGISSSGLRLIDSRSPAHYYATSYLNPNRLPEEQKEEFNVGKAAHTLLLGEAGFRKQYAVRPDDWSDWRTNAAKAWREEAIAAGRVVLVPEHIEAIKGIRDNLAREPAIKNGLLAGQVERSLFWKDGPTGVWLKSRPDVIPESDGIVVDLKTTTDASPDKVRRAIADRGYAMQGALIRAGMKAALGVEMSDFVLVWVEKTPPYAVNITIVDPEWIEWGSRQLRRAVDTFARCVAANEWPAYPSDSTISMPEYLRKSFEAQERYGLIPAEGLAA